MNPREQLLQAALQVYATAGYRGTTTRRIAEEAGVNEVTLFRHFGNKDTLIKAALQEADRSGRPQPLGEPVDPPAELAGYTRSCFDHFYRHRHLVCRVMGDMVEHPAIAPLASADPAEEHCQVTVYLGRMRERGMTRNEFVPELAAGLLIGGILSHALWRDHIADMPDPALVVGSYVELTLQAIGFIGTGEEAR